MEERVVTVTYTPPAYMAQHAVSHWSLQKILTGLFAVFVFVIITLVAYAFYNVYMNLSGKVIEKYANQDRIQFGPNGIGIRVKARTKEERDAFNQRYVAIVVLWSKQSLLCLGRISFCALWLFIAMQDRMRDFVKKSASCSASCVVPSVQRN
jgi:hypothetical protein